ncbi:lipopolysaccharide-induced tumor necrosis factor-alpha factor homolog [Spodoptera frugiperda]|uniref:Lipopolysaccharide-induced tumor necrosis factor-alpha factor homolog n=1 Tax=Spodoptera frugiperda TaxID=7108 RepID=A0A9R0EA18_SPOFR|nr:lipopolysaccharide-induced tumor necrosis factor-alpha factor homolog [Spodoptera frugiperda]
MEANPPPSYPGQAQPVHVNVINVQPVAGHTVLIGQPVGTVPALVVCQYCRHQVITTIEKQATCRAHLWAIFLFLAGCWPCMCIPYCTKRCTNFDHYCPNCRAYIGRGD